MKCGSFVSAFLNVCNSLNKVRRGILDKLRGNWEIREKLEEFFIQLMNTEIINFIEMRSSVGPIS